MRTLPGSASEFAYAIIEHKSRPDRFVAWQLLQYQVRLFEWWLRQPGNRRKPFPRVYSMVVYHGAARWKTPLDFDGLAGDGKGASPFFLNYRYTLVDLGSVPDEKMSADPALRAGQLALKYVQRPEEQAAALPLIFQALREAREFLPITLSFLRKYRCEYTDLLKAARKILPEEEPMYRRTIEEQLTKIGEARGLAQGVAQGTLRAKADTLMRLMARRFGQVPTRAGQRIRKADETQLDAWLDRILDAKSLKDALADS